jgi:hypothetical protein
VPVRVSPADRIRHHIDVLFAQDRPLPEILEEVARLGAQLLMQAALEAEVTEFLGHASSGRAPPPSPSLKTSPRLSEPPPSLTREAGPRPPVHTGIGACR